MEFPIAKLRKIGKRAFIIASSEAFGTFVIGFVVGHSVLQYQMFDSLFLALAISVTRYSYCYENPRRVEHDT